MRRVRLLLSLLAAVLLVAACGSTNPGGDDDRDPTPEVALEIVSDALSAASVGETYAFTLTATGIPEEVRGVTFRYSLAGGEPRLVSAGVRNGVATYEFRRAFDDAGEFEITAIVGKPLHHSDLSQYEELASTSAKVNVATGAAGDVTLTVNPDSVVDGEVGQPYTFTFDAAGIAGEIDTVRFSWGLVDEESSDGEADVAVVDGAASSSATYTFPEAGEYALYLVLTEPYDAADASEVETLAAARIPISIAASGGATDPDPAAPVTLTINPNRITESVVGDEHTFTFRASGIADDLTEVTFAWEFTGEGRSHVRASVSGGVATHEVTRTFNTAGAFSLRAYVGAPTHATNLSRYDELAAATATIAVDVEEPVRDIDLGTCEGWLETQSGGHGVTVDRWNLDGVPVGAVIDFRYNTIGIPDKFIIEYPDGVEVLDTGWVGNGFYNLPWVSRPYPGGIVSGPRGEVENVFTRVEGQDEFTVTVMGPDQNTLWDYEIRCRMPE